MIVSNNLINEKNEYDVGHLNVDDHFGKQNFTSTGSSKKLGTIQGSKFIFNETAASEYKRACNKRIYPLKMYLLSFFLNLCIEVLLISNKNWTLFGLFLFPEMLFLLLQS